jgi:hypothetical protein
MTVEEFNDKYAAYLPNGWYGLDIDDKEVIAWLDRIFEQYLTKIKGFEYHQIKLKYDSARFYSSLENKTASYYEGSALTELIETNINSILKLKVLQNKTNNTIKELQDKLNTYTNE